MDKPKPLTIDTGAAAGKEDYALVPCDPDTPLWDQFYEVEEMEAYLKTLTDRIIDLEAKLRHYQRNQYERDALDLS